MLNTKRERIRQRHCKVSWKIFDEDAKGSKIRENCGFSIHAPCGSKNKWCGRDKLDFSYSVTVLSHHCLLMSSVRYRLEWWCCSSLHERLGEKTLSSKMKAKVWFATAYKPSSPQHAWSNVTTLVSFPDPPTWGRDTGDSLGTRPIGVPPTSVPFRWVFFCCFFKLNNVPIAQG